MALTWYWWNFKFGRMLCVIGTNALNLNCHAPPTSSMGEASMHVQKSLIYASFWQLKAGNRRLAVASDVGSVK